MAYGEQADGFKLVFTIFFAISAIVIAILYPNVNGWVKTSILLIILFNIYRGYKK